MQHMSRKTHYRLHKWIAIFAGVFLLSWIVSGVVMILPNGASGRRTPMAHGYRHAVISPAQVAAVMQEPPLEMTLGRVGDRIVYRVQTRHGFRLVDAQSGHAVEMTPQLAETVVRSEYPIGARPVTIERVDSHGRGYG